MITGTRWPLANDPHFNLSPLTEFADLSWDPRAEIDEPYLAALDEVFGVDLNPLRIESHVIAWEEVLPEVNDRYWYVMRGWSGPRKVPSLSTWSTLWSCPWFQENIQARARESSVRAVAESSDAHSPLRSPSPTPASRPPNGRAPHPLAMERHGDSLGDPDYEDVD